MKTILVPTDFSAYSLTALQYSINIAQKSGSKVILMHAYDLMDALKGNFKSIKDEHYKTVRDELLNKLENIRKEICERENLNIMTILTFGTVTNNILFVAEKFKVDMIIMGTMGSTGIKTSLLGSKAISVLRNSKTPVLIIPKQLKYAEPKNVLITVKEEQEKIDILQPVFEMVELFKSNVSILTFTDDSEEAYEVMADTRTVYLMKERLHKTFPHLKLTSVHLSGQNFTESLQAYISKNMCDLLVMINHHRSWFHQITGSSATQAMALSTEIPLLSLNPVVNDYDY
jgi:nucleotide-binding universal stress UspA family protein